MNCSKNWVPNFQPDYLLWGMSPVQFERGFYARKAKHAPYAQFAPKYLEAFKKRRKSFIRGQENKKIQNHKLIMHELL
jgi:hypothetical protein